VSFINNKPFEAYGPDDSITIAAKDVLLNREYEYLPRFELKNFDGVVIDAGANTGLFSLVASNFAKEVVAIEPHPTNLAFLKDNLALNKVENVSVVDKSLWFDKTTLNLYQDNSIAHSLVQKTGSSIPTETTTLDELLDVWGDVNLLKLDVEGAEFALLHHADSRQLRRLSALVCEVHLSHGLLGPVLRKLTDAGFKTAHYFPPLRRGDFSYSIDLRGLRRLKLWRSIVYPMAFMIRLKERNLCIIFAERMDG
jgi:FkbM family methyltransferase